VEDALELVQKNFQSYKKGDKNAPKTGPGGIEVSLKSGLPLESKLFFHRIFIDYNLRLFLQHILRWSDRPRSELEWLA
jgi:hypothetical protein